MDIREALEERFYLYRKCNDDLVYRQKVIEYCERDYEFFINKFCVTYDPRTKDKTLPFVLWPFQGEFLAELQESYEKKLPLLLEKSRDMGASWTVLGWTVHKILFERGFSAGFGSEKARSVDDIGNMKSLLERARFMLENMPPWMTYGFDRKKHSKEGLVKIPEMGSHIVGEGGDNIGRGDRTSVYFLDEFAHVPRSTKVHEAVSQTTDVLCYLSTPNGKGNEFARLRHKTNIKIFTMHWTKHPKKDKAWYDKMCETLTPEQVAQEIDISYSKSVQGKVYKWFDSNIHAKETFEHDPRHSIFCTFDWGIGDPTACIILQDFGGVIRIIDHFEEKDKNIEQIFSEVSKRLNKLRDYHGSPVTIKHVSGWYGDPDGNNRERTTGNSIASYVKDKYGINLRFKYPNIPKTRITSVNLLGSKGRINCDKRLHYLIECLENYKYPEKEHGENEKPLHDWACHTPSALEYYCVYEHGMDQFEPQHEITATSYR